MDCLLPTDADTFRKDAVVTELFGDAALHCFHAIDAAQTSAVEYLNEKNGRLKLDVPHVRDELKVEMVGTVPEAWGLL